MSDVPDNSNSSAGSPGGHGRAGSTNVEEFVSRLSGSGVMNADQVRYIIENLGPEHMRRDASDLAKALVEESKLTDFQASCLLRSSQMDLSFGGYLILDKIATGGSSIVFKARHRQSGNIVALKVVTLDAMSPEERVYRFDREIQAAARLDHPNIVAAYDAYHSEQLSYLVSEYVEGQDLAAYVARHGTLPPARALGYILQAARGLRHAHRQLMVHRDIKPENLILTDKDDVVKILDMGLVRFDYAPKLGNKPESKDRLTKQGTVLGTSDYMSPEQAADPRAADYRSDIYSLGCTLYFLLMGYPPYDRDSAVGTIMAHQTDPIPDLQKGRLGISAKLKRLFEKMVAKKQIDRHQDIDELIVELEDLLGHETSKSSAITHMVFGDEEEPKSFAHSPFFFLPVVCSLAAVIVHFLNLPIFNPLVDATVRFFPNMKGKEWTVLVLIGAIVGILIAFMMKEMKKGKEAQNAKKEFKENQVKL